MPDNALSERGWIELPLEVLFEAPWNYKTDSEFMEQRLLKNIEKNGQVENLIVRPLEENRYEVVNGNHRLKAFRVLQFARVMCYNLGPVSEQVAKRLAIETNESKFDPDSIKLATLVKELADNWPLDELTETVPFTSEEIKNMAAMLDFNWEPLDTARRKETDKKAFTETMRLVTLGIENEFYESFIEELRPLIERHREHLSIEWGFN